jgi:hypothetical protein
MYMTFSDSLTLIVNSHRPLGFHLIVLYGPSPSSRIGLHFLLNIVALAGITEIC